MRQRSLQASKTGIEKAKKIFKSKKLTQKYLANLVGIHTRQPIWKFFTGKPVDRDIFINICNQLNLDWQEILVVDINIEVDAQESISQIDDLVNKVRWQYYNKIISQCGKVRLLDIAQPVELEQIYVNVNIIENIAATRWLDIKDLQYIHQQNFGLGKIEGKVFPALNVVSTDTNLMILGKPGSGKSIFLQNLAIQCIKGKLQSERIPIFIRLKNLENNVNLMNINGGFIRNYINENIKTIDISSQQIENLLKKGKFLILLDGLDEVAEADSSEIIKQIRKLSEEYYDNQFIITCRIATCNYILDGFTDIEIADFNQLQINTFAYNWFLAVNNNSYSERLNIAEQFIKKINLSENRHIRELAATPILLNLICLVFQSKAEFPIKRCEFYREGLDILLTRWDQSRGIKRDKIYQDFSLAHQLKLLSQIAAITFEKGDYCVDKTTLEKYITDYLCTIPKLNTEQNFSPQDSAEVLKSIQMQHGILVEQAKGIYSFSHRTLQEYLTAKHLLINFKSEVLEENINKIFNYLGDRRWQEVLLLLVNLLSNTDQFLQLLKQKIEEIPGNDFQLQKFFAWINQKSMQVKSAHKVAAIRAFYLTLDIPKEWIFTRDLEMSLILDLSIAEKPASDLNIDVILNRLLRLSIIVTKKISLDNIICLHFSFPQQETLANNQALMISLLQLKKQLPSLDESQENIELWKNSYGENWINQLRETIIKYRNIGYDWQFSEEQQLILQNYYKANKFLLACLNSDVNITPSVRAEIESTLLSPKFLIP